MKHANTIAIVPIESITPYPANPRKISHAAISAVAGSIKEFGFKSPIIVDKERVIINGHTRLLAAQQLGMTEVPIVIADDLTPDQVKAYRLADNRVAEFTEWDFEFLNNELESVTTDLAFANFDEMLAELKEEIKPEKNTEECLISQWILIIECDGEKHQEQLYNELKERGLQCKISSI